MQHRAVAVVDLVGGDGAARFGKLVACGQDSNAQLALHHHAGDALRGEYHDVGVAEDAPRGKQRLPRLDFLARVADVGGSGRVLLQDNAVALADYVFLDDHGAASIWHGCARHDADALARFQAACKRAARGGFAHDFQAALRGGGLGQRVAIHGGNVAAGDSQRGDNVLRQHAPCGLGKRQDLAIKSQRAVGDVGLDDGLQFGDGRERHG